MLSVALAFLFGFAAQRGDLCAVGAIHALIEDKAFGPFLSFLRCSAWVILIFLPVWWLCPAARVGEIYAFGSAGLAGPTRFGVGAAINGGCNSGTLTRFAAGDMSFAMTVVGGILGVWIEDETSRTPTPGPIGPTILTHPGLAAIALLAVVGLWCMIGLVAPSNGAGSPCWARLTLMVMGLTGGTLYLINGGWAYTLDVDRVVNASAAGKIPEIALLIITGLTGTGAAAAWTSGNFLPRLDIAVLPQRLGGGTLMGFGAVLAPGGNAVLIVHGIPTCSPRAVPDHLALCLGITVMLRVSGRLRALARFPAMLCRSVHNAQTPGVEPGVSRCRLDGEQGSLCPSLPSETRRLGPIFSFPPLKMTASLPQHSLSSRPRRVQQIGGSQFSAIAIKVGRRNVFRVG